MIKKYLYFANVLLLSNFLLGYTATTKKVNDQSTIKSLNNQTLYTTTKDNPKLGITAFFWKSKPSTKDEINIVSPALNQSRKELYSYWKPLGFHKDSSSFISYNSMAPAFKHIVQCLWSDNSEKARFYSYTKKNTSGINQSYIIIEFIKPQANSLDYTYTFEWRKKSYAQLTELEKSIANFYGADSESDLQLLYLVRDTNDDPWAITINYQTHSMTWLNTINKKVSEDSKPDPFLIIDPQDKDLSTELLLDENKKIIAKKIDNKLFLRD